MHVLRIQCKVKNGFIPAEKTVYITRADGGQEEVTVATNNLSKGKLEVSEVGRMSNRVLVELPRESASGRWRVWVKQSSVGA